MVEVSSLKGVLESFDFLSRAEYSDATNKLKDSGGLVEECRSTVEEISQELNRLTLANNTQVTLGKRKRLKESFQWCMKEEKTRKLLDETVKHKTTLTLALLGEITTDVKEINTNVKDVKSKVNETSNDVKRVGNLLSDKEQRDICDWIEQTNPTAIHERACKNHEKDTCQWIHRVDQWNDWLQLQRRTIWVHGIPGAGKTVLASYLINEAIAYCQRQENNSRATSLYYYCSFIHGQNERRNEALPCLRWIVSQLCRRNKHIPSTLVDLHRNNSTPNYEALMEALLDHLSKLDVLYLLVDGVDESSPRQDLLELIQDLANRPEYGKTQLLITSRRYADIDMVLRPLSEPTLPISNSIVDEDIRVYVEASVHRNLQFRPWPQELKQDIVKRLVEGAQGMFRWAVCQIDRLQRKSPQQAKEAIKNLPETIEDTYETIFLEIHEEDRIRAKAALEWIYGISEIEFSFGMPGNCLITALDRSQSLTSTTASCNACYEHDCLKAVLGCLIEVTVTVDDTRYDLLDHIDIFEDFRRDRDTICRHEFALAHYTIAEFLFSERLTKSRASYMAMSRDKCVETILKVACQTTYGSTKSQEVQLYPRFEDFCISVIHAAPLTWSSLLDNHHYVWQKHYELFEKHGRFPIWNKIRHAYYPSDGFAFIYGPSDNPIVLKMQYALELASCNCGSKFEEIVATIPPRTMWTVPLALKDSDLEDHQTEWKKINFVTFLEALHAIALFMSSEPLWIVLDVLIKQFDPSILLQHFLQIHEHQKSSSEKRCTVLKLLHAGANVNAIDLAYTPLQVAVFYRDYEGVKLLLRNGADPNGIGRHDGHALAGVSGTWTLSSPLYLCRHVDYLMSWGNRLIQFKSIMNERSTSIEALLLQHGARDFSLPRTSDSRPQKLELQYLLN